MNHPSAFDKIWNNWLINWPLIRAGGLCWRGVTRTSQESLLKTGNNYGQLPWWISQQPGRKTPGMENTKNKIKCYKFSTFPKSFQDSKSNTSHSMPQLQNIAELLTSSLSGTTEMIFSIIFILYIPAPAPLSCVHANCGPLSKCQT